MKGRVKFLAFVAIIGIVASLALGFALAGGDTPTTGSFVAGFGIVGFLLLLLRSLGGAMHTRHDCETDPF